MSHDKDYTARRALASSGYYSIVAVTMTISMFSRVGICTEIAYFVFECVLDFCSRPAVLFWLLLSFGKLPVHFQQSENSKLLVFPALTRVFNVVFSFVYFNHGTLFCFLSLFLSLCTLNWPEKLIVIYFPYYRKIVCVCLYTANGSRRCNCNHSSAMLKYLQQKNFPSPIVTFRLHKIHDNFSCSCSSATFLAVFF